jgi:hypothetical protein
VLQRRVYRSRTADIDELKTPTGEKWGRLEHLSCVNCSS